MSDNSCTDVTKNKATWFVDILCSPLTAESERERIIKSIKYVIGLNMKQKCSTHVLSTTSHKGPAHLPKVAFVASSLPPFNANTPFNSSSRVSSQISFSRLFHHLLLSSLVHYVLAIFISPNMLRSRYSNCKSVLLIVTSTSPNIDFVFSSITARSLVRVP